MATTKPALLTAEEYMLMGEDPPGERWELNEGMVIVSAASLRPHNDNRDNLNAALRAFVRKHRLGVVLCETDVKLAPRTVRRPHVAFLTSETIAGVPPNQYPQPRPDVAVEVVSDYDRAGDLMLKVRQYFEAGAASVWLLYPRLGLAHRYASADGAPEVRNAAAGDVWTEPELIPGFSMPLAEIFEIQ